MFEVLFFEQEKTVAIRTMDIIEKNIQNKDAEFFLDKMAIGASYALQYEYQQLFLTFQFLPINWEWNGTITRNTKFFYGYN